MIEDKSFDYEKYIQKHLKDIDNLEERRFAKELLLENLGKIFQWTEDKYNALEQRIQNELDVPWKYFNIFMTIVDKKNYDPINSFWFPVWEEDIHNKVTQEYETIYLEADEKECQEFLEQKTLAGINKETGQTVCFRITQSSKYQKSMEKLYTLFTSNHVPWQTMHMGHVERFFDLIPMEEAPIDLNCEYQYEKWNSYIKREKILLWNIQKTSIHAREYRIPCIDEVFYEHIFYLPEERAEEDGYLVETGEDILSIRYEKNKILLKTQKEALENAFVYRLHQKEPELSMGYLYPVLSNRKNDNLSARYLQQTGNFIQTPMELYRKIGEMSGEYSIEILGYEIVSQVRGSLLSGDMNGFTGVRLFSNDQRNILLLRIRKMEQYKDDYLYESQIRYILSQIQMEFLEYRCMGKLMDEVKEQYE